MSQDDIQGKCYAVQLCGGPLDGMIVAWHEDVMESGFAHDVDEDTKQQACSGYRIVSPNKARYLSTSDIPETPPEWGREDE